MTSAVQDFKIVIKLVDRDQEIETIEKTFAMQENAEETQMHAKSINEVVEEFLKQIQETAQEKGYTINKEVLSKTAISLILGIFGQEPETTINVELAQIMPEQVKTEDEKVKEDGI